ncbi:MAG: ADP-ribosylglycohydrolase family protein [Clostridia bacterium]|nr:ADP-ribosylglycohydrolase family protein [Clostridia bacterium]
MRDLDKFRGCLIGGAAGDALGYPVEFMDEKAIFRRYGQDGITQFELRNGEAMMSDDTQMTLFTAVGLVYGHAHGVGLDNIQELAEPINGAYLDWLTTQKQRYDPSKTPHVAWLGNCPGLYSLRAPGNTCLNALSQGGGGRINRPINNSKGCGGVMRVAPIGLFFCDRGTSLDEVGLLGAGAAALTHGHMLGWLPGFSLAQLIFLLAQDGADMRTAVEASLGSIRRVFPESTDRDAFLSLMEKATDLAGKDTDTLSAIHALGEGWVGDEALAIAVYCAMKYEGDMERALIAAVNHKGDSDSTGAIAGNLVGAQIGKSGIPTKYMTQLELLPLIEDVADDLWRDGPDASHADAFEEKYVSLRFGR